MFQNIKVDIIYYKTNTDFEMEFNLCGCCRMRLLTDKAPDKKTLVHNLARAVGRSRVILVAGDLFGEEGIIETVSRAIGKSISPIDNKLYGISVEDEIKIIEGAIPLVTRDGCLGGCIIESGPQTMILLSENKAVRKTIMTTLIHPYIEELCAADLQSKAKSEAVVIAEPEAIEEAPENIPPATLEALEEIANESDEAAIEEAESEIKTEAPSDEIISIVESEAAEADTDEKKDDEGISLNFFTATDNDDVTLSGNMSFEGDDKISFADSFVTDDDDYNKYSSSESYSNKAYSYDGFVGDEGFNPLYRSSGNPKKRGFNASSNLAILIISIILLIVLAVLCYCIFYVPAKDGVTATAFLQETFDTLFG